MNNLTDYIASHTERGECQCGLCIDKQPDRPAPAHSVDTGFFWVSAKNNPTAEELNALLLAEYPGTDRLKDGPSYIEIGGVLGDQGLAIRLIGLGVLVKIWTSISPASLGIEGEAARNLLGRGCLFPVGWEPL